MAQYIVSPETQRANNSTRSQLSLQPILFETGNWTNVLEPELLARYVNLYFKRGFDVKVNKCQKIT